MNAPGGSPVTLVWPARTNAVPKAIFDDPELFEHELENIFYGPEWHPVAVVGEIPRPGDFKTIHVGRRPLLVVRGDDSQVRVFYNACAHRGTLLETRACGNQREFECPYHRWLFDALGQLRGAPGKDDFAGSFRSGELGLSEVRSVDFGGLLFVILHPAASVSVTACARPAICGGPAGWYRLRTLPYSTASIRGNRTPGNALFQKGVHDEHALWFDFKQNDEAGNMPRWEWYRRVMGFERAQR